ncbi:alpha/beta fold hydrolase [Fulvivirga ulvae]|uniref:bifunctional alpha/beta hydrolase/OsmC family protein n=1 Tax=Fulvivirga ulvae TaxID=2904245 RepID=UPI001F25F63B|nr:bifunctional alpha/beta hydrolase/OsmC family protein [Fulvivirga ulvae]UII34247.1 alpha/beta fold hydrolase [Fulvivirga ulvae]
MNSKKVSFKNAKGQQLSARLELPVSGKPAAYAIFAHCFTCSKNLSAVINISRALTSNKIAVLRFDFTGLGESEGEFSETNFSSNVSDLVAASEYLSSNHAVPGILIGHSLGGAAVLASASSIASVKAVITIGAPADPPHVKKLFKESLEEIKSKGEATVSIGGRDFRIKDQLLYDLQEADLKNSIGKLKKALLIMHSPQDTVVSIDNAQKIYERARHPKSFITLDGADHLISSKEDSIYTGNVIATWATRYIDMAVDEPLSTDKQVICQTGDDGYITQIQAGGHPLIADEPTSVGGNNLGPTPYDLLVSALGACTGMTLRMYADRKKWPLEKVHVHLQHSKIHKQDCDNCDNDEAKLDLITREIELSGDLTDEQKERLLEIADKCPVHKTLHVGVQVKSVLV